MAKLKIGILLFDGYETLDAHGPIEMLGTPVTKVSSSTRPVMILHVA